ncbi:hypothetical protein M3650_21115 [Paenibacillus sp. MER TA 81-3]|uniref:AlkZ-related protein n=1 Tax=Paenibacillus sp. MER TA 81-3 TaxID=2939573 RepID=UPI00203D05E3|nr:hypothetical protein [Paenibacillus sp. MER TA 81-3]MCM3341065.1 hypothetical protein [Paenibacillus sp. MER TA 81-3]
MKDIIVHTYDEAVEVMQEVGILPLAKLIPDHPSLSGITKEEQWHSDTGSILGGGECASQVMGQLHTGNS